MERKCYMLQHTTGIWIWTKQKHNFSFILKQCEFILSFLFWFFGNVIQILTSLRITFFHEILLLCVESLFPCTYFHFSYGILYGCSAYIHKFYIQSVNYETRQVSAMQPLNYLGIIIFFLFRCVNVWDLFIRWE